MTIKTEDNELIIKHKGKKFFLYRSGSGLLRLQGYQINVTCTSLCKVFKLIESF